MGKLSLVEMVIIVFAIVAGVSYLHLCWSFGIYINKNTWTGYVKDVGLVCAEQLERNRRDPDCKWSYAQWDEVTFGKKKYGRGPGPR